MVFEEPKVDFVRIDMSLTTQTTSGCNPNAPYWVDVEDPSVETCNGTDAPMNNCSKYTHDGFYEG